MDSPASSKVAAVAARSAVAPAPIGPAKPGIFWRLARRAHRAHADEEGGSMVFGAITLFTMVLFVFLVYQVGMTSGDRLQLQGAADAGAYSGALVEAESLESIAFLNDGMAYVYYAALRYAVDAAVYGTLNAFWRHDDWVKSSPLGFARLIPLIEGPWIILEYSVDENNPGARPDQSYVPWDQSHQTRDYSWVEMGDPGTLFENRYKAAFRHAQDLVPKAKKWLQDIHFAERIILAATPSLVEKTCARVGLANGATWVGVSSDLDQAFHVSAQAGGGASDTSGFTDGTQGGSSNEMDQALTSRYQDKSNPVDDKQMPLPSWFNGMTGDSGSDPFGLGANGYSQVRLCWNRRDWDHSPETEIDGKYSTHPNFPGNYSKPPNGHWHVLHAHMVEQLDPENGQYVPIGPLVGILFNHYYGHGITSGDDADRRIPPLPPPLERIAQDETDAPNADHHAAQMCPTCYALDPTMSGYSEVEHTQKDGEDFYEKEGGSADFTQVHFDTGVVPSPLRARGQLFRAGITVATWRPSRSLGNLFHGSPFGLIAIASAQVGLRTQSGSDWVVSVADSVSDDKVTFTNGTSITLAANQPSTDDKSAPDNLYLGEGDSTNPGMHFGARLVPIARTLTWVDGQNRQGTGDVNGVVGSGLQNLLYGSAHWYNGPDASPQGPPAEAHLDTLKDLLDVSGSASAFVH